MRASWISCFFSAHFLILMLSCYSPTAQLYRINGTTSWTYSSIPVLIRETNVAKFAFGFFCEGYCTSYLLSVAIYDSSGLTKAIVWSANRDYPVGIGAVLVLTEDGELVIKDEDGSTVWTTKTLGKSVAGMNLTDTGNLVLFDDQNSIVWQSFDHPTDCLLPGQKLFQGQKLQSSVSLANSSVGMYSLQVMDDGLYAYIESNPPQAFYFRPSYGDDTNKGRKYISFLNGSLSLFIHSSEPGVTDDVIDIPRASSAQYMKLMSDGHLQLIVWQSDSNVWRTLYDILTADQLDNCSYPLVCGRNSVCSPDQQCSCPGTEYFKPVNHSQGNLGCSEVTPLTCNSTQDQHFITLEHVTYFTFAADMKGVNMETCKQACLNNCSCKAAFFRYYANVSNGNCFLPSEILTMKNAYSGYYVTLAFIKVQNVTSHTSQVKNVTAPPSSRQVKNVTSPFRQVSRVLIGSVIGSFGFLLVVVIGLIMYRVHKRNRDAGMEEDDFDQVPGMPNRFSYEELKSATENFSRKLGEGGFGSVFEGNLKDGSKIAVKCLKGVAHVKKSFLAEVQSIGSIHHVNLVRLRGFCTWKSQRFLVYDFMSNGSLDRWIYHGVRDHILEWENRKKIILDIAKGLAYLHEDCRQKIVHLDIKPQNILLDNNLSAKVSDFGLSKLIDKNQTQVMSTIKGTPGYIAPERRSSVITEKADVYSFGIVLLEILCGRKFFDKSEPEESMYLLSAFEKCWEQGTLSDLVDKHSEDMQVHKTETVEMMKVASWCLQNDYNRRPSMSTTVKVLEGGMNVESNLDYNFTRIEETIVQDKKNSTQLSPSLLSGPR